MNDKQLPDLQDLWHEPQDKIDANKLSHSMLSKTEKTIFRLKLIVASEIFAALLVMAFLVFRMLTAERPLYQITYGAIILFTLTLQILLIYWRRGLWRSPELSMQDNAKFHLAHARFKLRMTNLVTWGGPLGLLLGFGVGLIEPLSSGNTIMKLIVLLSLVVIAVIFGLKLKRRALKDLHQAQTVHDELVER